MVLLTRPLWAVALLGLDVATPVLPRRAASIRSLSSSSIYTTVPHQVGRGRMANTVFQVF